MKILIVDDQREVRRMLKAALEAQFQSAILQDVPSAEEAMVLLSQDRFDLLVVDVRLAGMSGLEMVEKARRRQPNLNIVVVTGVNDPAIHKQLEQAPIQAWFRKPLPMEEFLTCVLNLLGETATPLPLPQQEPFHPAEVEQEEHFSTRWDVLCEQLGLQGLWIADAQGNLLAHSMNLPASLEFSRLIEYFSQTERELHNLQIRYGGEAFSALGFYLSKETVAGQFRFEDYAIIFGVDRRRLPTQPLALQQTMAQKALELLAALERDLSDLHQRLDSQHRISDQNVVSSVSADTALEALLQNPSLEVGELQRVDEFWEQSLASEAGMDLGADSQMLYFHQARQLGLLPSDENEESLKG
ncbi:MAG: hypothetical protein DDG59_13175 [Anaerolineae bacterium]|jgi:DNA-binding response OmpR family regulator|nr:MAG: hypothetical protein DDG59_13175 [Anaerolineae bacterium]